MNKLKSWIKGKFGHGSDNKKDDDGERKPKKGQKEAERSLEKQFTEHQMTVEELSQEYPDSGINADKPDNSSGLSSGDAKARLEKDGPNALKPPKGKSDWMLLLEQFLNLFWLLMIGAGILSMVTYVLDTTQPINLYVSIVLFAVTIFMCLLSFWEEKKARKAVRGFENLMPKQCAAIRDGGECEISAEELVVGDLVYIRNGTQVPADVRLLSCNELKLDNSSITGEAEPIEYTYEPADKHISVFESENVAFNGSLCCDGEGLGVVIRTADKTVIGQIASLTTDQTEKKSSLQAEISRFVRFITILALTMATLVFIIGAINAHFENLLFVVINGFLIVIIANVPEGLPATVTSQLTIIARVMAKKQVFLKKLDVIEAFGAATIIASDKTGTLTQNNMTVTDLWYNKQHLAGRPNVRQRIMKSKSSARNILELYHNPLPDILAVMTICNNAQVDDGADSGAKQEKSYGVNTKDALWKPSTKGSNKSNENNKKDSPKDQQKGKVTEDNAKDKQTKELDSNRSDRNKSKGTLKKEVRIDVDAQDSSDDGGQQQKDKKKTSQKKSKSTDESMAEDKKTTDRKDREKSKKVEEDIESASSSSESGNDRKQKLSKDTKQKSEKKQGSDKKERSEKKQKSEFTVVEVESDSGHHSEEVGSKSKDKKQSSEETEEDKTVENKAVQAVAPDTKVDILLQRWAVEEYGQELVEDKGCQTEKGMADKTKTAAENNMPPNEKSTQVKETSNDSLTSSDSNATLTSSDSREKLQDKKKRKLKKWTLESDSSEITDNRNVQKDSKKKSEKVSRKKKQAEDESSDSSESDVNNDEKTDKKRTSEKRKANKSVERDSKQKSEKATRRKKQIEDKSSDSLESDDDSDEKADKRRTSKKRKANKSSKKDAGDAASVESMTDEEDLENAVFKDEDRVKRDAKKSGRSGKDGGKDQFEESQPKALSEDEEEEKPKKRKKSNSSTSSSSSSLSDSSDNKKSKSKKEKKKKEKSKKEKSKKAKDSKKGGRKQTEQMSMETSTHKQFSGSPSEVALLRYAAHLVDLKFMRSQYETIFEIPFNSLRKWHLVIAKLPDEGKKGKASFIVMMKGAVEKLIEMCSTYALNGEEEEIDDEFRSDCDEMNYHFGSEGRRVIGFVYKKFEARADTKFTQEEENYPLEDLCFLGMAAIMDPPRDDTAKAIKACKAAGIKVFMVTGDHPITASAIARQIGLIGKADEVKHSHRKIQMNVTEEEDNDSAIVHGETLLDLNDEQWDELLSKRDIVFARTTPELKLLIVEQCQKRGEIVAATGDGVNDAPALKRANIGIAMGGVGSEVAKQAASIVLMDDDFSSIVRGIEEGRRLYDNLKKTIAYTLAHWLPEIFPVIMYFAFGFPQALTALQILSIDLLSELPPAVSLAYEGSEKDIMKKPPRKLTSRLVGWSLLGYAYIIAGGIITIGCMLAYLYVYWSHGIAPGDLFFSVNSDHWKNGAKNFTSNGVTFGEKQQLIIMAEARAAYHITLVMSQVYHLWTCTTRRQSFFRQGITNYVSVFAIIIEILLVNLFAYTPGVQEIMGTSAPPYQIWFFSIGVGIVLWVYNETRKYFIRHYPKNKFVRVVKW